MLFKQKSKYYLFLLFVLSCKPISGQYALGGIPGTKFYDVVPDTLLSGRSTYSIDINLDGIMDIAICTNYIFAPGGILQSTYVAALNSSSRMFFGYRDSTYIAFLGYWDKRDILKSYDYNDSINSGKVISSGYLSYYLNQTGVLRDSPGWIGLGNKYFGVRYIDTTGTYFGWVKVNVSGYIKCLVYEYSLGVPNFAGMRDLCCDDEAFRILPNPTIDKFYIQNTLGNEIKGYSLFGLDGKKLFINQIISKQEFDVSSLPEGLYFLQIQTNCCVLNKKIVVSR